MARTNGDDDLSSSACSAGSRLLRGEGDLTDWGLLLGGWSWWSRGEKLHVGSDRAGLRGTIMLPRRGVVAVLRKATFSSLKEALVAKNEANC